MDRWVCYNIESGQAAPGGYFPGNGGGPRLDNAKVWNGENMDTLSHAYIVTGPKGEARTAACLRLAMARVCNAAGRRPCGRCVHCRKAQRGVHPDIRTIAPLPDKKELLVDQIRELVADCAVMPNEAEGKVYIIEDADKMNLRAQNALLKQLEEPPRGVLFLLAVENAGALLPTVRSRCIERTAAVQPRPEPAPEAAEKADALLDAAAAGDRLGVVSLLLGAQQPAREQFDAFLDALYLRSIARLRTLPAGQSAARQVYRKTATLVADMAGMRAVHVGQGSLSGHLAAVLCAMWKEDGYDGSE